MAILKTLYYALNITALAAFVALAAHAYPQTDMHGNTYTARDAWYNANNMTSAESLLDIYGELE